ncbi:retrovirus-related pol polyprotein from transposon TNT 1-94 [Tanacetum coccineum]
MSDPTSKPSDALLVKIEAPKELPKISLVNESLKKLKFHLAKFDNVVKIRTTPNARTEDVLLTVMNSMSLIGDTVNMDGNRKESCNLEAELLKSQNAFNDLLKKFFENSDLKAQLQDKDSIICKLKDIIKSLREKYKEENVNYDYCEIETKKVELENSVAKFLSENGRLYNEINHVKQVFKEQFDSIKKTRVCSKEQGDSLIDKLNLKSAENEDLKARIQDKVFVITSLKNDLQKLKGKEIVDIVAQISSANTIVPGMFKLDLEPLAPKLLQNRGAHLEYLKYTQEQADILRGIVKQAKANQRLDKELDFSCSTKKAKIVESKNANHSEPNPTWGSNATNIPSSSSLVMTCCPDCSLVSGFQMFETHDRESLSAHELSGKYDYLKGKSKKSSHQPKAEDTNQENLYLLHMDLCGPMRVASINGKRTKDEAPEAIIKCIKNIQVRLNATVHNVGTDNGTEFVNQTLREFYENVGISHQTFVGVVERQNQTLVEALMQDKKLDLSFFHVFGALCYPTNDNDDLGKLDAKADIGPGLHSMTPMTSSSRLVPNPVSQQPCIPPPRDDWDCLFQPMFNEYFTPSSIAVSPIQEAVAPRAVVLADSPVSTSIDQDAPSSSTPSI